MYFGLFILYAVNILQFTEWYHTHIAKKVKSEICAIVSDCNAVNCSYQAPLSMGFFSQEYWKV